MADTVIPGPGAAQATEDVQEYPVTTTEALLAEAAHGLRLKAQAEAQRLMAEAEAKFQEAIIEIVRSLNERRGTGFATDTSLFQEGGPFRNVSWKAKTITMVLPAKEAPPAAEKGA